MGAPRGNNNAAGSDQAAPKPFIDAITRACKQEDGKRLRAAAEQLLDLAAAGEAWAIKELADRLDGKAKQQLEHTGAGGGAVEFVHELRPQLTADQWLLAHGVSGKLLADESEAE